MSTSSGVPESWISSFCSLLGHEYFAEVSEEFIEDDFNLTGLQTQVAMYKEALEVCFFSLFVPIFVHDARLMLCCPDR
jgi:casein kinase II subunit beta